MGENTAWLVPIDQDLWRGRGAELADALWDEGIFAGLHTTDLQTGDVRGDDFIYNRLKEWRATHREIPVSPYTQMWDRIIISDLTSKTIVPDVIDDLCCPRCMQNVSRFAHLEAWTWGVKDISQQFLHCSNCAENFISTDVRSAKTPFRWASFVLMFTDLPSPDALDEDLVADIEALLGKCDEFHAWST